MKDAYAEAAAQAVAWLDAPEVAASWGKPSALAEWTVGGLAGHLMYQIFSVTPVLWEPESEHEPISLADHYARAVWIGAPLDGPVNAGIRAKGDDISSEGVRPLRARARAALDEQRAGLAHLRGDRVVFMPQTGWALTLDDFLVTRMLELAVHMDDLAVSVGSGAAELPPAVSGPVIALLTELSARRHGRAALLRAFTRAERAPDAITVF